MNVQCVLVVALGEQKYLYGRWKSGAVVGCQVLMVGTALCRGTCSKAALYPISQHRNSATVVYEVKKRNMQVIRCMYTPDLAVATRMDGQDKISAAARCTVHFSPLEGMHCFLTADIYLCFLECQRKR